MGTEVLRPQDCLFERIRAPSDSFYRRRGQNGNSSFSSNYANSNPRPNRKPAARSERSEQRKRCQSEPLRSSPDDVKIVNNRVMEKVTILRRGESLDSKIKSEALRKEGEYLVACGIGTLGPDPEILPYQIRIGDLKSLMAGKVAVYAGSAFAMSPAPSSPSSLPLPSFSKMKSGSKIVDDSATRDLRRLLRIDALDP